jgi:hypothetical protein
MLSERQMERAQIDSDTYEYEWLQSVIRTAVTTMEEATRHSRSDTVAGIMDRLSDLIGEIDHELETLGRS